ncbi:ArsR/SmtB family transcription factor [Actinacidiphila epipremni]|uniref:Winged helix-turn-helix transcriptional regulator n=1 Tax=Actinacidiphila epipremni TaxID=2053013 RepID=A0ABX0ZSW0_9ACTN|nr:winged helix-turn-helix domain-containing protein [Actinacidiphila epipremni]NJP47005.1 winged helix-turn-helix transcriptional regulator [Actinacidiphila epipremni]
MTSRQRAAAPPPGPAPDAGRPAHALDTARRADTPRTAGPQAGGPQAADPRASGSAPDLAGVAKLLADGTRAGFLLALLDGRAWTAAELARHAGVAPSTATGHLNALVAGGLLAQERQGRHRYVRLAGPQVAEVVESLAALAPGRPAQPPRTLSAAGRRKALAHARTCYDHLAGAVGVALTDAMVARRLLDDTHGLGLTAAGAAWLADLGVDVPAGTRRPAVRSCLDWTERRPHLAGAVGAALCRHAFDAGWITRVGTTRAVAVTPPGARALRGRLGLPEGLLRGPR